MSATEQLAALASDIAYDDLPTAVKERCRETVRDVVGVSIAGSRQPVGEKVRSVVASGGGDATLLDGGVASPGDAALANGTFGEALAFDDTFEAYVIHPSATAFPAALGAAELEGASGRELFGGYVAGVETTFQLGRRLHPDHYNHGWHSTGTLGAFGAAAAAGSVLSLSKEQLRHAFGIAASCSSSLRTNGGSMTFAFHAGNAAQAGLRAARLAARGMTADPNVLDGEQGYEAVTTPESTPTATIPEAAALDEWGTLNLGLKAYPCARVPQAAMDAVRQLHAEHEFTVDDVQRLRVQLDPSLADILDRPSPDDITAARGSIEFCVAVVLREGTATPAQFTDDYVQSTQTRAAMAKVEPRYDENLGAAFSKYGAKVVVETAAGEEYVAAVRNPPGSPENRLSEDRQLEKFRDCVRLVHDRDAADDLLAALDELHTSGGVEHFLDTVRSGGDH